MRLICPESAIGELKQLVTIIHGEADSMVPYSISHRLAQKHSHIKLYTFKDMDHGFMDKDDEYGTSKKSFDNRAKIFQIVLECVG